MNFSITRMLLAVAAFVFAFAAFSRYDVAGIIVSVVVGSCTGLICLIVKPNLIWPMIRTGLLSVLGGFVGRLFCPMVHPPYNPGDELYYIGMGIAVGFVVGGIINTSPAENKTNNQSTKKA